MGKLLLKDKSEKGSGAFGGKRGDEDTQIKSTEYIHFSTL